ncbi:DoxX family membrane protein [Isoptericola sediminis]|uniref:DoxX family membrane protein n=1 Tax=Isoptericola sediminis TaxID=2733572 RepID=A0A849K8N2_9MICO|nr:DoxX family membrane protein [Isoptericola sediminis]NNU28830.1 DoxX family membrane protein [Isoptericola sediminis]
MTTASAHQASTPTVRETSLSPAAAYTFAVVRLLLAVEFLWAFFDKTFGLGVATPAERAWISGGSPTTGYLSNAEGTFGDFFSSLANNVFIDWLFMLGLLGIGLALLLGIGMRVAAVSGAILMLLMWLASLPLENNPFVDYHLVDAVLLVGLAAILAGDTLGLGKRWGSTELVQRFPWLR